MLLTANVGYEPALGSLVHEGTMGATKKLLRLGEGHTSTSVVAAVNVPERTCSSAPPHCFSGK